MKVSCSLTLKGSHIGKTAPWEGEACWMSGLRHQSQMPAGTRECIWLAQRPRTWAADLAAEPLGLTQAEVWSLLTSMPLEPARPGTQECYCWANASCIARGNRIIQTRQVFWKNKIFPSRDVSYRRAAQRPLLDNGLSLLIFSETQRRLRFPTGAGKK